MGPEGQAMAELAAADLAGLPEPEELESLGALLKKMLAETQAELDRLAAGAS
jgi:hypothetical protein